MGPEHHEPILMSQFQENLLTDGRTDGRTDRKMDRQTLFYRTLPVEAGGPIKTV